jgi:hypothetical protein
MAIMTDLLLITAYPEPVYGVSPFRVQLQTVNNLQQQGRRRK